MPTNTSKGLSGPGGLAPLLAQSRALHLIIIALVALAAYSNIYDAPFQWDEQVSISENPIVHDLKYAASPSLAVDLPEYGYFIRRYVAYVTFALNYRLHGLDVTGYHIFNNLVHVLNGLLVYFLVVLLFSTPALARASVSRHARLIGLFSALIFVAHPVQIEAVTYIMQRYASLCAFFYLGAVVLYLAYRLRLGPGGPSAKAPALALYALMLLSVVLAAKTKETAMTLPLAILMCELMLFEGTAKTRALMLAPVFATLIIFPLSLYQTNMPLGTVFFGTEGGGGAGDSGVGRGVFEQDYLTPEVSRPHYLLTQSRVIMTYIRLLFLPLRQNFDYDYPVYTSVLQGPVIVSLVAIAALLAGSLYLVALSRRGRSPALLLVAFGIFWFFLTLSVESSVLPIPMLIAEYRLYLPMTGVAVALVTSGFMIRDRLSSPALTAAMLVVAVCAIALLAGLTYARNNLWRDNVTLWEDVVSKSPLKARAHYSLGIAYMDKNLKAKAIERFSTAIELEHDSTRKARSHYNMGLVYFDARAFGPAEEHFRAATTLEPRHIKAYINLSSSLLLTDRPKEAAGALDHALAVDPGNTAAHYAMGLLYRRTGKHARAVEHYHLALSPEPGDAAIHSDLALSLLALGREDEALAHLRGALKVMPSLQQARYRLVLLYLNRGETGPAIGELKAGLRLEPQNALFLRMLSDLQSPAR